MTCRRIALGFLFPCMAALPLAAQIKIGGGTCSSASLNGTYAVSITGRQVTAAGTFTNIFQATGSANFDGLSKFTFAGAADTLLSAGAPLAWSGTYSMQANCVGSATVTSGGSAGLNLVVYNQGSNLLITGTDPTYFYAGSGNLAPAACSTNLLSGSYAYNGTGYGMNGTAVNGVNNGAGLFQFDGQGKAAANITIWSGAAASNLVTATGSYSVSSNCMGSATLTDSKANTYTMGLSITAGNAAATTDLMATMAQASKFTLDGAAHTLTNNTCSVAALNDTYSLTLGGRAISAAGSFAGSYQGNGSATFDGKGNVTLAGTANTNLAAGKPFTYTGTYTLGSNCTGTVTLNGASPAAFTLVAWSAGKQFNIVGADATYVYSGSGGSNRPDVCGNATLSGAFTYDASGYLLSGTSQTGVGDEIGIMQFDGQGKVTSSYTVNASGSPAATYTATGTYSMGSNCLGTATLLDSTGKTNALNFSSTGAYGQGVNLLVASPQFVRSGAAHTAFLNPTQSIGNVASYAVNSTPPGSVFALFGDGFAARALSATATPLPATLGSTSVTVNGEPAPLFYADPNQIDAQMPWDIPGGTLATVIVKNGTATSNAAAVWVPATGTPGISVYSNNRAVVVNQNGTVNSPSDAAAVGDQVVAYFTGGGPVQVAGKLVSGAPAPGGLAPVTGDSSVTVGGTAATVKYIGLTPGSIGLYQVNFVVPQLARGTYPVVIDIAGNASNNPVMTLSN
ncbi:MAG TPA: hypothetical protein VMH28_15485 [Candidatus Acidoferrales bacterium]|nr:hypothetical protein [Candidatus Acidoferrales bacterium]